MHDNLNIRESSMAQWLARSAVIRIQDHREVGSSSLPGGAFFLQIFALDLGSWDNSIFFASGLVLCFNFYKGMLLREIGKGRLEICG